MNPDRAIGGHTKAGNRRPHEDVQTLLDYPYPYDENGKARTGDWISTAPTMVEVAWKTLFQAMGARDDLGNVTGVGLRAALAVLERKYGKTPLEVRIDRDNTDRLILDLSLVGHLSLPSPETNGHHP